MAGNSRSYSRSPDSRVYGTATFSSRSPSYDGRTASPDRSDTARSYTSYTRSNHSDTYYDDEGETTIQEGDSTTEVERDLQLDDEDEEYYSETERTRSPARSFVSESHTYGTTRSPSRTQTYDSRAPSRTQTYDSRSPSRTDTRSPSRTETYTDAPSRSPSRTQTYTSRSASRTPTTNRSPSRAYSAYSNDDDETYDDAQTYEDRSEARTDDDEASAYDDGRSGSAFYDDGRSGTGSGAGTRYDDSRSLSRLTGERTASQSASRSASRTASRYEDDASAHSGYDDAQSGYDDAHSAAYDDAQGSDYHSESQVSDGQNYPASQGGRSQSARSQGARSQGARSETQQSEGQYSEDYATSASSSINPQEILASLHSMTLDPVSFERKVLSTVEEQTERTSSSLSRLSATRFASGGHGGASGSEVSLSPTRRSGHSRASSEAASLFSPSTHGSYLSSGGPSHTPLKLFSPNAPISALGKERATSLERPATAQSDYRSTAGSDHSSFLRPSASEQNLKLKDKEEVLIRHPSATMGRRAGDLIAFFESAGSKSSSEAAKSVGSVSPGKLSVGLPARTYASGSGSGSGSYTGSGSDVGGSSVASPFSRPRGAGVGLGFDALFSPSFPSRTGSPFRPASPTKSTASGTGSFASGSHKSGASQIFGGSQTYRSDGGSETAR
ncbi:hypothetical protein RSAG8_04254, partial [Rhizoctonia solani AG-8 WAC10335]